MHHLRSLLLLKLPYAPFPCSRERRYVSVEAEFPAAYIHPADFVEHRHTPLSFPLPKFAQVFLRYDAIQRLSLSFHLQHPLVPRRNVLYVQFVQVSELSSRRVTYTGRVRLDARDFSTFFPSSPFSPVRPFLFSICGIFFNRDTSRMDATVSPSQPENFFYPPVTGRKFEGTSRRGTCIAW